MADAETILASRPAVAGEKHSEATSGHMLEMGLTALQHALWHSNSYRPDAMKPEYFVLQATHAAEMLIKARITQDHPLTVFDVAPVAKGPNDHISMADIFGDTAKIFQFAELPNQLKELTGVELPNPEIYAAFAKLRLNTRQLTWSEEMEASELTRRLIFEVLSPFINSCWGLYAIDRARQRQGSQSLLRAL